MRLTLVAAVARNGVIGLDGAIPWRLTGEQAHFKALTTGHVLVMGRATFESIGRPLPGRTTVVLTRSPDWEAPPGVLVADSLEHGLELASTIDDEVFVGGGAAVYASALPLADRLAITEVDAEPAGDTWWPETDWSDWRETARSSWPGYEIVRYERAADPP